jgi:hypothetical protein
MTNNEFKIYIAKRLDAVTRRIRSGKLDAAERRKADQELELLETSARIARLGGPALRRYRRDYERRCARLGVTLTI